MSGSKLLGEFVLRLERRREGFVGLLQNGVQIEIGMRALDGEVGDREVGVLRHERG